MQLKKILKRRVQIPNYYKNFSIFHKERRLLKEIENYEKNYVIAMHDNQNYTTHEPRFSKRVLSGPFCLLNRAYLLNRGGFHSKI